MSRKLTADDLNNILELDETTVCRLGQLETYLTERITASLTRSITDSVYFVCV